MRVTTASFGLVRRATVAAAAIATLTAVSVGSPASASVEYPPGVFSLTLSASVVPPGASVTATVPVCETGIVIRFTVDGTNFQQDAPCQSPATVTFNAPSTVGQYTVRATELGGQGRTATAQLTVTAPGAPDGELPATGSDAADVATYAAVALVLGVGAVILARRHHPAVRR